MKYEILSADDPANRFFDCLAIRDVAVGQGWHDYEVIYDPYHLSDEQLVDIMDNHRFNFGFRKDGRFYRIYTD